MNDFKYLSDKYDIHNTQNYRLSIQLNPDGFSVLMAGRDNEILMLYHKNTGSWAGTFFELKENNEFLPLTSMTFGKVTILLHHHKLTLIPEELYSGDLKSFYYRISQGNGYDDKHIAVNMPGFSSVMVFGMNDSISHILKLFRNNPEVSHSSIPYLSYLKKKYSSERGVFVQAGGNMLSLSILDEGSIKYHNIMPLLGQNDIIYHTLNACRQQGREFDCEKIFLSGTFVEGSETMKLMEKYFPRLVHLPNELPFELAWDLNENYFVNLLESLNCVS